MEKMYHVGFDDTHGAKYVILPGDPGRVEKIAQFLDEPHFYCCLLYTSDAADD